MKRWLSEIANGEAGLALPIVLAMLALGSLLMVPSLNFAATSLKTGEVVEGNVKGLFAAEAGVEDALWRIKYDPPASFPYSYQVTGINGLTVDITIDEITTISGEDVGSSGDHDDWLQITKLVSYDAGIYSYTMSLTNNGNGNIKIEKILIDFPPELDYVAGSTGGDITTSDPEIIGNPTTGITLVWDIPTPYPAISPEETKDHTLQLSGPPDIAGVEGHGFVQATRDDIGTVWDSDSHPYTIWAQAKDDTDTVVATIRAGVWAGGQLEISCWQVDP